MGRSETNGTDQAHRDQTDDSLRAEREGADAVLAKKSDAIEQGADATVQRARDRADAANPQEDGVLRRERATADAALDHERAERKRYLTDFLADERDATDQDLIGERAQADTAITARDDLLVIVRHDLRSLIGGLSRSTALLLAIAPDGAGGDALRKHAGANRRLITQMNRLVNDLLDLASIEAGRLSVLLEDVDVAQLLREAVDDFAPIALVRRITVVGELDPTPLRCRLDRGRVHQVLANLVGNALKFTPPEGRVTIRIRADGDEVHCSVHDTGPGIPPDALAGVFDQLRQGVDRDRRGLGLGLHISKQIVEAHGGRIWVASELPSGSAFHFALPASPPSR